MTVLNGGCTYRECGKDPWLLIEPNAKAIAVRPYLEGQVALLCEEHMKSMIAGEFDSAGLAFVARALPDAP